MKNNGKSANNSIKKRWDTDKPPKIIKSKKPKKTKQLFTSYSQVIHIKLWITFLFIFFQKSLAFYIFMCYNTNTLKITDT